MNWYDKAFVVFCLLGFIGGQASYQAALFKNQKTISHFWKTMWYILYVAIFAGLYILHFNDWKYVFKIGIYGATCRAAFYDPIMNWARSSPFFYNSTTLMSAKQKGSWLDKLENKLSIGWVKVLKVAYVIAFIIVLMFVK